MLAGHAGGVAAACGVPGRVVTASLDGSIKVWAAVGGGGGGGIAQFRVQVNTDSESDEERADSGGGDDSEDELSAGVLPSGGSKTAACAAAAAAGVSACASPWACERALSESGGFGVTSLVAWGGRAAGAAGEGGGMVAAGSLDGAVRVWDAASWALVAQMAPSGPAAAAATAAVTSLAARRGWLYCAWADGAVRAWAAGGGVSGPEGWRAEAAGAPAGWWGRMRLAVSGGWLVGAGDGDGTGNQVRRSLR